jgi:hypothetical protein
MNRDELSRQLARSDGMVRGIAVGYGAGLLALGFGDVTGLALQNAPRWMVALFITVALAAGFVIAQVWSAVSYAQHLLAGLGETVDLPTPEEATGRKSGEGSQADKTVAEWSRVKMFWPWMLGLNGAAGVVLLVAIWVAAFS